MLSGESSTAVRMRSSSSATVSPSADIGGRSTNSRDGLRNLGSIVFDSNATR